MAQKNSYLKRKKISAQLSLTGEAFKEAVLLKCEKATTSYGRHQHSHHTCKPYLASPLA